MPDTLCCCSGLKPGNMQYRRFITGVHGMFWHVTFCLSILLLLSSCGRGQEAQTAGNLNPDRREFVAQQLEQLERMSLPVGADSGDWSTLKKAMRVMLQQQLEGKTTLQAPASNASASILTLDNGTLELSWDYASQGDYDQNRETNIADLSALATHFGENTGGAGPFPRDSVLSVVDGDSNGEINIADVGPIGANFGRRVITYQVLASLDLADFPATNNAPDGSGAEERAVVDFAEAQGSPVQSRLRYTFTLPSADLAWFYWVRPLDGTSEGTPSNVVSFGGAVTNLPPVAAISADPTSGTRPLLVNFDASGSSDPDGSAGDITDLVTFQWDFDGNGTVDATTTGPTAQTQYQQQGTFNATVTVFDAGAASAQSSVPIDVDNPANVKPNAQLTATPTSGAAPLSVKFDFSGSADTDGTIPSYRLDLDGDGANDFDSEDINGGPTVVFAQGGVVTVTLLVIDNQGATDEEALDLNISGGFTESVVAETGDANIADIALAPFNAANAADSRILVAYADSDTGLRYLRSTNEAGTAWDAATVEADANADEIENETIHLGVVQGRPAVAYTEGFGGGLFYKRADNATGSSWPQFGDRIDSGECRSPSLRIVNGNPAVAYFCSGQFTGDDIFFARNDNINGDGFWDISGVDGLSVSSLVPKKVQLVFSNDTPAVIYLTANFFNGERADNQNGSDWDGDSTTLVDGRNIGFSIVTEDGDEAVGAIVHLDTAAAPQKRELFAVHETNAFGAGGGT
ncbi:MAG: PKD domain-containing protein, partial [bacterium]|nr:PKD domain-containing protein [bacterium]